MRLVLALLMLPLLSFGQQMTESAEPLAEGNASTINVEETNKEQIKEEDQEDTDFKPTEEISEDFPISLPYDI
ncbi:MAG: hypothetical protein ACKJRM_03855 [Porticoccaceae bacterium]|tara:strand:- start:21632 stop:21850 length:219 start_codon:yes stop_codon:yes gene_type:complete